MKTFYHIPTSTYYPEHGCVCGFDVKTLKNGKIKGKWFLKGKGWMPMKMKDWRQEEIEDLIKPCSIDDWREYAKKYGVYVAQEFLDTCDYMKPWQAYDYLNPDPNEPNTECRDWFISIFECDPMDFENSRIKVSTHKYSFDILKFEDYLVKKFDYSKNSTISISDFMKMRWGKEVEERFAREVLAPGQHGLSK